MTSFLIFNLIIINSFITFWVLKLLLPFRNGSFFISITNIIIIILLSLIILHIISSFNTIYCAEDLTPFFERQHNTRVELIKDLITNTTQKDVLVAIHKVVHAKKALLNEECVISNDIDMTHLIKDPVSFIEVFKRLCFWILFIIIVLFLDGFITFGSFLFNDTASLQGFILNDFSKISSHYALVNDVYNALNNLKLL